MANVRFYLKSSKSSRRTSIFMMVHFGASSVIGQQKKYLPLKYYINETICPANWNKRTGRAKEQKLFPQHAILNERLRTIENSTYCILLQFKNNAVSPSRELLKEALDKEFQKKEKQQQPVKTTVTLFSFIEQFIDEAARIKANATIVQYRNTLRILKAFGRKHKKQLDFEDINLHFHTAFRSYMNELGYSETYFGNQIKCIRLFMNEATERGYNKQLNYKSRKFTCPMPETTKIYLTEKDIACIQKVDLSGHEILEKVRDLFIVGCNTGLRFSDLVRLNPVNFVEGKKILRIETQKTKELVYIPLAPDVINICKKYDYQLPFVKNNLFNFYIKKVGEIAGVRNKVEVPISKGKETFLAVVEKYKLICAHTARRSFATNAYLANVPSIAIMRITGHRTERAFMKYIRICGENNARQLLSHPHFLKKRTAS